jgi:hypothetical protein
MYCQYCSSRLAFATLAAFSLSISPKSPPSHHPITSSRVLVSHPAAQAYGTNPPPRKCKPFFGHTVYTTFACSQAAAAVPSQLHTKHLDTFCLLFFGFHLTSNPCRTTAATTPPPSPPRAHSGPPLASPHTTRGKQATLPTH